MNFLKKRNIGKLKYNENFRVRFKYLIETILAIPIGAITAFLFQNNMKWAFFSIIVFLALFIAYCVILVIQENKVSVLSIMSEGLKDGRYEDVIKFGSAMSPTLFTSNKNFDRVTLGRLLLDACNKLSQTEHSARDDIMILTGGTAKPVKQIKIELLLDDLGWSLYLVDSNSNEATSNIQQGIKHARLEIQRIKNGKSDMSEEMTKKIEVYMKLILRGYRHLTGIYYTKTKTLDLAKSYERITQFILSGGRVLAFGGACAGRSYKMCKENLGGMICSKEDLDSCIMENIKNLFCTHTPAEDGINIEEYIDLDKVQISEADLIQDKDNYLLLSEESHVKMLREQSYAWSRNTVKLLQKSIHYSWDVNYSERGQIKEIPFVSDEERICKLSEAVAYARFYFYGMKSFIMTKKDKNDFEQIIIRGISRKEEQRYLSLINEISLIDCSKKVLLSENEGHSTIEIGGYNAMIETVIMHIKATRDACRGLRADLFARNTGFLMRAYLLQYNLNFRYNMGDENNISVKKNQLKTIRREIKSLREEVIKYEHSDNEEVTRIYKEVYKEMKIASKEIKKWKFKEVTDWYKVQEHYQLVPHLDNNHISYVEVPDEKVIAEIKGRWKINE